jgi:hypothetical protein
LVTKGLKKLPECCIKISTGKKITVIEIFKGEKTVSGEVNSRYQCEFSTISTFLVNMVFNTAYPA